MNTETAHAHRFNTDPILGTSAEGALFTAVENSDGSLTITPVGNTDANLAARIYYTATYYDSADRPIATVNAGTNPVGIPMAIGTTPWTRPSTPPASSLLAPRLLGKLQRRGLAGHNHRCQRQHHQQRFTLPDNLPLRGCGTAALGCQQFV
jgi:hypothetical protein